MYKGTAFDVRGVAAEAHGDAMRIPIAQAAALLRVVLGPRLIAFTVAVEDTKTVKRWADGAVTQIRPENERRLRIAYEVVRFLSLCGEEHETIRAWFMGMSPELDDISPAEAIHGDDFAGARDAARGFAAQSGAGVAVST